MRAAWLCLALWALASAAVAQIQFREVSEAWGLDFRHHHGGSGEKYMVETMVGGLAFLDYDGDGDEDVLFVDGGALPGYDGEPARTRLLRNDQGSFVDTTTASGLVFEGYGCGVTSADYDGDGDVDIYLTAYGANLLLSNQGDGTFLDATLEAGVGDALWSASAGFADVDRDGDLDLYVANYVDFAPDRRVFCGDPATGRHSYCHPGAYDGVQDRFYRNQGEGRFVDATKEHGFIAPASAGLGVVFGDIDADGWPDLYVANDAEANFMFQNLGDGTFEEIALFAGTAYGSTGNPEAGMGVDFGDVDGDLRFDLIVTNFDLETNALYYNEAPGLFSDRRFVSKLAEPSLLKLAFGVDLADLDNDGDLDVFVANGHVLDDAKQTGSGNDYEQVNQVFENGGDGTFDLVEDSGVVTKRVSRGMATADLDGDGDLDVGVVNSNGLAEAYENVSEPRAARLDLDLRSATANSHGIGARIEVLTTAGARVEEVRTASSFLSQNALTVHFGLGSQGRATAVEIAWPSGLRQRFTGLPAGRVRLVESQRDGTGR